MMVFSGRTLEKAEAVTPTEDYEIIYKTLYLTMSNCKNSITFISFTAKHRQGFGELLQE